MKEGYLECYEILKQIVYWELYKLRVNIRITNLTIRRMVHLFGRVCENDQRMRWICMVFLLVLAWTPVQAQQMLRGSVKSADSLQAIAGATVQIIDATIGTSTDSEGLFSLRLPLSSFRIKFYALGFQPLEITRLSSDTTRIEVLLEREFQYLEAIDLRKQARYRNRDNPAVALIRQVIAHKNVHRLDRHDFLQYKGYEKINMALKGSTEGYKQSVFTKGFRFFFENIDTTLVAGQGLLPFYLEERLTQHYSKASPKANKVKILAEKKTEFDKRFINNENIETYFKYLHTDVDLYDNTILLVNRPFTSPLSDAGPLLYKYFIKDTLTEGGNRYVRLDFEARNPEDKLLTGSLEIALDEKYAVRAAEMHLDKKVNLNWVDALTVSLRYEPRTGLGYMPVYNETKISFGLLGSQQGLFGIRTRTFEQFDATTPLNDSLFRGIPIEPARVGDFMTDKDWQGARPIPLRASEQLTYQNVDSLRKNSAFRRTIEWGSIFLTSFKNLGPIEAGPLEYSYSFNELEGNRFRLGGRTSRQLSEKFYAESYVAYGTKDQAWKYYGNLAFTLNKKRIASFPAHYIQFVHQKDAREPGERMDFLNGDSFVRSFRQSRQDHWLYNTLYKINHVVEWGNHVMLQTSLTQWEQSPAAHLKFLKALDQQSVKSLNTTELGIDLRWAPHEEFFQRNLMRTPIVNEHPILSLRYQGGLKGFFGGEYAYHNIRFDVSKRLMLSQLGFTDASFGLGYLIGSVPYPLLQIPMTNQSYLLAPDTYSLMNNLEFVSDQYLKFGLEHHFHGFFLNKIPGIRYFKLRESVRFNYLYGQLRKENDPVTNGNVYLFPTFEGAPSTFTLQNEPYMEGSVGLENIFRVLRVEYVRRFSYLENPNVRKQGWRFSVKIDF